MAVPSPLPELPDPQTAPVAPAPAPIPAQPATPPQQMPVGQASPQPEEPLAVGEEDAPPSTPETMEKRAQKFKYGLGDLLQKTKDEIYQDLQNGNEDALRGSAASLIDVRKAKATQDLIAKTLANKQAPLTDEEKQGLVDIVQNMNETTDPSTVMETAYGKQFIATLDRTAEGNPDNILTEAQQQDPEAVAKITAAHAEHISKQQVIDTKLENVQDSLKSQGYLSWGYDFAKFMIPGYTDYQERGNVAGTNMMTGVTLGENLDAQRRVLMRMPPAEMSKELDRILGTMSSNPQLQMDFLQSMKGLSSDESIIKSATLPLDIAGTGIGGKAAKMAGKGLGLIKTTEKLGDVKKAAEDVTRAASAADASKSTIEAAAGDLKESAVTRATTNAVADKQNVPQATKRAVESLSSTNRADLDQIAANPGRFGQDIVNRIEERGNMIFSNLMDTAENIQKVERLPDVLSNETAVRTIVEDMKNKYRDLKNTVIDTSPIYHEPLSNTYLVDFHLGEKDGSYFTQRSVAENFIKYHKLGGAEIAEGTDAAKTTNAVAIAKANKEIQTAQEIIAREQERLRGTQTEKQKAYSQGQIEASENFIVDRAADRIALRKQAATVQQQGLGYYVKVTKPIDETRPVIRDALVRTGNTKLPTGPVTDFLNSWVGKLRTPEEVLSSADRKNRLTATYTPATYMKVMVDNAKEIKGLTANRFSKGRKRWEEWQRGLENAMELPDPIDKDRKGYFFQHPAEMESYWQQWFHRLPDQQEIAAYFEFKRGMEIDRVFRNLAEHRNQQRLGAETHNIHLTDAAGNTIKSKDFSGVIRQELPTGTDNIAIFTNKVGEEKTLNLSKMSTKDKKALQKDIDAGRGKLVELYNPRERPLSGYSTLTDERIRYAYVPELETRPLDYNHVPRRGGGHVQYDYDYYIKQAQVKPDLISGAHYYEGDTTIMAVPHQGIGERVAEHLNQIRLLLKDKKVDEARAYSNKNMHVSWGEVESWFKGSKDATGKFNPPRLSVNEKIHVVPKNKTVIQHDNELRFRFADFRDATREGSLAAQNRLEFGQERDAFELLGVNVEGTKANPLYKVAPADKVDPITVMNRGMARIIRSNFMDDYKTMAVEHWLQQAKNYLDVKTQKEIYHSPFYHFAQTKFLPNTPPEIQAKLEAARYHIQQLTGQPSLTDGLLHSAAQKLADMSFQTFGPKGLVISPTWALPFLRDPFKYIRSIAFNVKLGLYNLPQFIVQAGNYSNILGIAGYRYAAPGTLGAQLHFWSTVNSHPNIIEHLDRIASKMTLPGSSAWKPGEFKEALTELNRTGFGHTGGEFAALDNNLSTKIIQNGLDKFIDWGQMPFRAGETNARYGAWYTAFKEFRDKNPLGRITNEDRAQILQRADLLNVNMSRASSSAIHKGIWSPATQFYTYQIRLTELVLGTRLSGVERGRLLATNAALFGVPMAAGMTSIPASDYLRQKALEHGYVVGDNFWKSLLMEGIPSAVGAIMTGGGDPQAGTWYDIGPRFGTKGLEFLGSATQTVGNKGWLDYAGGPAYSIIKETIGQTDGLARAVLAMAHGGEEVFPLTVEDIADVAREITSFNSAWRVYAATQFGRWVSKKDAYLSDISPAQAIFGAMFGVKDQNIDDMYTKNISIKQQQEYERGVEDQFRQEFRRGVLAQKDNPELAKKFFTRATAWLEIGGYREDRINSLISKAVNDDESILDKTNFDFYLKKAPDADKADRVDAFRKTMQIQDKKNGVSE